MRNRSDRNLIIRIAAFAFIMIISAGINNNHNLSAQTKPGDLITTEEKTPAITDTPPLIEKENKPDAAIEITPAIEDLKTPEIIDGKTDPAKKDLPCIKCDELMDHPDIILNAYKEAYPGLVTEVTKGENDWIIKFKNGNFYYWADGKLLPESSLMNADRYIRYSIYAYNVNGRSPELYTKERIESLRVKKKPIDKNRVILNVEGSIYKELFAITTKKSAKKQLKEVKLSGHYIKVHHTIADKIKSIDSKIKKLAKTDTEVRSYLKNISSVQAFNWRRIAGTDRLSNHSFGIAIDILPKKYRKKTLYWSWEQDKNEDWMLLPQSKLWTPPEQIVAVFRGEGFIWGGHWDRYDTMHFEYRPELISLSKNIKFE